MLVFFFSLGLLCGVEFALAAQLSASTTSTNSYSDGAEADRITDLPGASSSLLSAQFSGYLEITETKALHYMYFESERDPTKDPVIFWTNGGPGCSGLLALYTEFGPWRVSRKRTLLRNPFTWTKYASIVFLEQPVGVGFSYSTVPISATGYNDFEASKDNLRAIKIFFSKFPERAGNPFFLASESYGGHYIPQWTLQVLNDKDARKNFKGFLLGNPYTSYGAGSIAMANAIWGLQLAPKPLWDAFTELGCESLYNSAYDLSDTCFNIMDALFSYIDHLNPYALEYPTCELVVEGPATAEVAPAQDFSSTASTGTTKADAHRTGPRHSNSDNRKHSKYVSPQAAMLLQMHSRVRSAPAYLHYRARIARDAQLSSVLSSDLSSDLSSGPGSDSSSGPRSAASFNEQVTSDIGISGSAKTDTDYSQYALGANWDVSVIRAHSNAASAQEVHVGVGRDHSGEPAGKKRGSATTLSEESEFAYDPCAETYINEYLGSLVVQKALHVFPDPRTPQASHSHSHSHSQSASALAEPTDTGIETPRPWGWCSDVVNNNWAFWDYLSDTTQLYRAIYEHRHKPKGFKMLIYSGDVDGVCATIGTQHWIYNVTHSSPTSLFKTWTYDDVNYGTQLGGYLTKFKDSLSFLTVRYAGHEVPAYQPQKAVAMFHMYLEGTLFDATSRLDSNADSSFGGNSQEGQESQESQDPMSNGGQEVSRAGGDGRGSTADGRATVLSTVMAVMLSAVLLIGVAVCFRKQLVSSL